MAEPALGVMPTSFLALLTPLLILLLETQPPTLPPCSLNSSECSRPWRRSQVGFASLRPALTGLGVLILSPHP